MAYLPISTEIAERERLANQSRTISLLSFGLALLLLIGACTKGIRENRAMRAYLLIAAAGACAVSKLAAKNLGTHDRVLEDFRDISDAQRQQLIYESLAPAQLLKSAAPVPVASEPVAAALPTHNISRAISSTLKSTVLLGAPRAGKGYALAHALELLPKAVDLWLIDPKDDSEESHYWRKVPTDQQTRFDVTTLAPNQVDSLVNELFERFLLASSSADKPKLLIVDECAPGLAKGMSNKAYKSFMGRLSTICSVGPSKGKFVWVMAQASTVDDLAMSNGNKASFRLCAVGHAEKTEASWFFSLKRSMGIDLPDASLTGYIQMLNGQWGYAEPFTVAGKGEPIDNHRADSGPILSSESREVLSYFEGHESEQITLRQLTQASFARRLGLTSQRSMMAAIAPLIDAGKVAEVDDGFRLIG